MGQALLSILIVVSVVAAVVIAGAALKVVVPPRLIRRRLLSRIGLAKRLPVYKPPRSRGQWAPWRAASALMSALSTLLIVVLIGRGAQSPPHVGVPPPTTWTEGVDAGWSAASWIAVALVLLATLLVAFVVRPRTLPEKTATVAAASGLTFLLMGVFRGQLRISPEFGLRVCLLCGGQGEPPPPLDPATFELTLQGGGAVMECPADPRHRIGAFQKAQHEHMVGGPDLETRVAAAVDAVRAAADDRTLRAFVVVGSADEESLTRKARERYDDNADLAHQRAQAVAARLPAALGPSRVGAPPTLILGGDAGLVRWAEGPRETLSAREVRLCALWEAPTG